MNYILKKFKIKQNLYYDIEYLGLFTYDFEKIKYGINVSCETFILYSINFDKYIYSNDNVL